MKERGIAIISISLVLQVFRSGGFVIAQGLESHQNIHLTD